VGASIGITVGPNGSDELIELMNNGEKTLYHLKETSRRQISFYDEFKK